MTLLLLGLIVVAAVAAAGLSWRARVRRGPVRFQKELPRAGGKVILFVWLTLPLMIFGVASAYGLAYFLVVVPLLAFGISRELRGRG